MNPKTCKATQHTTHMHSRWLPLLIAAFASLVAPGTARADVIIENVNIVDIESGAIAERRTVLIEGNRIERIADDVDYPEPVQRVDGEGRYLIPGLWDSHVHVFSSRTEPDTALPLYLIHGITGVRDMGALWPIADQKALQARIESGEVLGPRLVLAGAWVDANPGSWPGMFLADTPNEARGVVTQIEGEGWAAVKSYSMLDEATYLALAKAAQDAGLPLVGHIPEQVALLTTIAAGQRGMEHFGRIPMACSTAEGAMIHELRAAVNRGASLEEVFAIMASRNRIILETWDEALCERVLQHMAAAQMHVSPTLVVADFYLGNWPDADAPRMMMIPAEVRES
ncbi:MAG: hypothetical protein WBA51_16745 [Erythrobacter sp.]